MAAPACDDTLEIVEMGQFLYWLRHTLAENNPSLCAWLNNSTFYIVGGAQAMAAARNRVSDNTSVSAPLPLLPLPPGCPRCRRLVLPCEHRLRRPFP